MWLDQTSARELGRPARIHGAAGVMPTPLWFVALLLSAHGARVHVRVRGQRRAPLVQGLYMGSVVTVVASMLLLLRFLDDTSGRGSAASSPSPWSARRS